MRGWSEGQGVVGSGRTEEVLVWLEKESPEEQLYPRGHVNALDAANPHT